MKKTVVLACVALLLAGGQAFGSIVGVSAGGAIIAAPASALDGANESSLMQGFDEAQDIAIGVGGLAVDGGLLPEGMVVSSHMIFLDPVDGDLVFVEDVVWTFDGVVVGVMSDYTGSLEVASSADHGAAVTAYPAGVFNGRGMEGGDQDKYSMSGSTLTVSMQATAPGDWIRVITTEQPTIPEPATIAIWSVLGLVGCVVARRRRK